MDLYTTSFSYPRTTPRSGSSPLATANLNLPGSANVTSIPLPNVTSSTVPPRKPTSSAPLTSSAQAEKEWEAVQKLALDVTSREGCLVTVTREHTDTAAQSSSSDDATSDTTVWNFHLSGGHQSVMAARGAILRELPRDNRTVLKVARTDMLESPLSPTSALKSDVQRRLDDIAADSKAFIAVVNPDNAASPGAILGTADGKGASQPSVSSPAQVNGDSTIATTDSGSVGAGADDSTVTNADTTDSSMDKSGETAASSTGSAPTSAQVTYGLETERLCELVITGGIESVEIAKVRLLVMLDELVSTLCCPRGEF